MLFSHNPVRTFFQVASNPYGKLFFKGTLHIWPSSLQKTSRKKYTVSDLSHIWKPLDQCPRVFLFSTWRWIFNLRIISERGKSCTLVSEILQEFEPLILRFLMIFIEASASSKVCMVLCFVYLYSYNSDCFYPAISSYVSTYVFQ